MDVSIVSIVTTSAARWLVQYLRKNEIRFDFNKKRIQRFPTSEVADCILISLQLAAGNFKPGFSWDKEQIQLLVLYFHEHVFEKNSTLIEYFRKHLEKLIREQIANEINSIKG